MAFRQNDGELHLDFDLECPKLRKRYCAMPNGTESYELFRRGNAPSYRLAARIDRCHAEQGEPHVLEWADISRTRAA